MHEQPEGRATATAPSAASVAARATVPSVTTAGGAEGRSRSLRVRSARCPSPSLATHTAISAIPAVATAARHNNEV